MNHQTIMKIMPSSPCARTNHTYNPIKLCFFLCTNILLNKILGLYLLYQIFLSVDGRGHKLRCDTSWACPPRRARLSGGSHRASHSRDTRWSGTAESRTPSPWCLRQCTLGTENEWPHEMSIALFFKIIYDIDINWSLPQILTYFI